MPRDDGQWCHNELESLLTLGGGGKDYLTSYYYCIYVLTHHPSVASTATALSNHQHATKENLPRCCHRHNFPRPDPAKRCRCKCREIQKHFIKTSLHRCILATMQGCSVKMERPLLQLQIKGCTSGRGCKWYSSPAEDAGRQFHGFE